MGNDPPTSRAYYNTARRIPSPLLAALLVPKTLFLKWHTANWDDIAY